MNRRYDILLGIALVVAVAVGYTLNHNSYFHTTTGEEINSTVYENLETKKDFRVEWHFNYEASFTSGLTAFGIGLILTGAFSRNRSFAPRLQKY